MKKRDFNYFETNFAIITGLLIGIIILLSYILILVM
jgi:hypothetical protein